MMEKDKNALTLDNEFLKNISAVLLQARENAKTAVNLSMVYAYYEIGRMIVEEEQHGKERAEYGSELIKMLAKELTHEYGSGFSERYLAYFRKFYVTIPDLQILQTRLQNLQMVAYCSSIKNIY